MPDRTKLTDKDYKGEDFACHQDLEKGPMTDRKCTDFACYILFGLFLASMFGISVYGYSAGAPYKLVAPLDSDGRFCGFDPATKQYPNLYISDIGQSSSSI